MGYRGAAQTGFVGEDAPGDAETDRSPYRGAGKATRGRSAIERRTDNCLEGPGHLVKVHGDNNDTHQHVGHRHHRYDSASDQGNTLYATENDASYHQHQNQARGLPRHAQIVAQHLGNRIGLHGIGETKSRHGAEQGEGGRQYPIALTESVADVVHRAAAVAPPIIPLSVLHGQHALRIFGRQTKQGCNPHPKQRTRPPQRDCGCHPGDVARAYGGRQGGHQGPEGWDIAATLS